MIIEPERADLLYPDARSVARCYVCKERIFGRIHVSGRDTWDSANPPDAWLSCLPVFQPDWIGLHRACEDDFIALAQTPRYRQAARRFIRALRGLS